MAALAIVVVYDYQCHQCQGLAVGVVEVVAVVAVVAVSTIVAMNLRAWVHGCSPLLSVSSSRQYGLFLLLQLLTTPCKAQYSWQG